MFFRNPKLHKPFALVVFVGLFVAAFLVGGVCAGSIYLDVPADSASTGNVITIPVMMEDAQDIAGFTIDVSNTVPGAVVTIDKKSHPLEIGSYMFNSKDDNTVQRVLWYSAIGLTADNLELFSLQINVTSADVTEIPITVTPITIVNSSSGFLTENYPVTEVTTFPLTNSATGRIIYGKQVANPVATATPVSTSSAQKSSESSPSYTTSPTVSPTSSVVIPTQSSSVEDPGSKQSGKTTDTPTIVPASQAAHNNPASTQASPLSILPLLGVGFAGIVLIMKKN